MKHDCVHTKTVVIGAGVSGISTAVSLLKNSYTDFLIFEALDRIGGRCHTFDYGTFAFMALINGSVMNELVLGVI